MAKDTIDSSTLPDPNEIKSIANEQTTQLSLRVKESTRSLLEVEATKSNLSLNSLVSTMLDQYATQNIIGTKKRSEVNLRTLQRHLETAAKKASSLDAETLLKDTIDDYLPSALFEGNQENNKPAPSAEFTERLIRDCAMWAEGKPTHFFKKERPYFYVADGAIHAVNINNPARAVIDTEIDLETMRKLDLDYFTIDFFLPIDKWLILMAILTAFEAKAAELFPEQTTRLGYQTYRILEELANSTITLEEFAQLSAQIIIKAFRVYLPLESVFPNC